MWGFKNVKWIKIDVSSHNLGMSANPEAACLETELAAVVGKAFRSDAAIADVASQLSALVAERASLRADEKRLRAAITAVTAVTLARSGGRDGASSEMMTPVTAPPTVSTRGYRGGASDGRPAGKPAARCSPPPPPPPPLASTAIPMQTSPAAAPRQTPITHTALRPAPGPWLVGHAVTLSTPDGVRSSQVKVEACSLDGSPTFLVSSSDKSWDGTWWQSDDRSIRWAMGNGNDHAASEARFTPAALAAAVAVQAAVGSIELGRQQANTNARCHPDVIAELEPEHASPAAATVWGHRGLPAGTPIETTCTPRPRGRLDRQADPTHHKAVRGTRDTGTRDMARPFSCTHCDKRFIRPGHCAEASMIIPIELTLLLIRTGRQPCI